MVLFLIILFLLKNPPQTLNIYIYTHIRVYKMLSKKDIVEINKDYHTGKIANESSLDFALAQVYRSKNWLKTAVILSRAILVDHVFEDGNKRTAAGIITTIMEMNTITYSPIKIDKAVVAIAKKNITSIRKIEQVILNARE